MIRHLSFGDSTKINRNKIFITDRELKIEYPCEKTNDCTYISFTINPGLYNVSLCGASGGIESFDEEGETPPDSPSAGGFVNGMIRILKPSTLYAYVGGRGISVEKETGTVEEGGFNGGGGSESIKKLLITGGGSTDIRADINSPFHRIIVAGGGGGSDDVDHDGKVEYSDIIKNDGKGGAGGGLISQSFFVSSSIINGYEATQSNGYSFLNGESGSKTGSKHPNKYTNPNIFHELAGAGGGWFGGFASYNNNGGASGGSSFALTYNSTIPQGLIHIYNKNYESVQSGTYAFNPKESYYIFTNVTHQRGVWYGNGWIKISQLQNYEFLLKEITIKCNIIITPTFFSIFLFLS